MFEAAAGSSPAADSDSILCRLCGRRLRAISNTHLVRAHGFAPGHPIDDYKKTFQVERAECEETRRSQISSLEMTWERQGRLWTPERVKATIAQRAAAGAPLNSTSVRTAWPQLIFAARKHFGSWDRALTSAGIDARQVRARAAWSRETIIAEIRRRMASGAVLRSGQSSPLRQAARRAFGSWEQALRVAGVAVVPVAMNG